MSTNSSVLLLMLLSIATVSSFSIVNITQSHRGCGAVGINITPILNSANASEITPCCIQHDACYSTCNISKSTCDNNFYTCMKNACTKAASSVCFKYAKIFYEIVKRLGLLSYEISQAVSCRKKTG
mgnify:FL=1